MPPTGKKIPDSDRWDKIFAALGVDVGKKSVYNIDDWQCYDIPPVRWDTSKSRPIRILLVQSGPKNLNEVKCLRINGVVIVENRNALLVKIGDDSYLVTLENYGDFEKYSSIIRRIGCDTADDHFDYKNCLIELIKALPTAERDFDSRGVFSTHYLRKRLFGDTTINLEEHLPKIQEKLGGGPYDILDALGWKLDKSGQKHHVSKTVSIVTTDQDEFGARKKDQSAPSNAAVSELKNSTWVILTNGTRWRLYTSHISAKTTNFFEIVISENNTNVLRYLVTIFSAASYSGSKPDIEMFYKHSQKFAREIEEDLASKILRPDGLFLDVVKGVLDFDRSKIYEEDLEPAKQDALKIIYGIWFVLYSESRDLLPTEDERYGPISLWGIRENLDTYESKPDEDGCWKRLLRLFRHISKGSKEHNLPQYNGDLFRDLLKLRGKSVQNKYLARALRELTEKDGEALDYASLGVRHLGNIYESLIEVTVRIASKNILLKEDSGGFVEVESDADATYSYKKGDLYLATKGGMISRKTTASYYTPHDLVEFLVRSGLEPIFAERERQIKGDIKRYKQKANDANHRACIDRLLDIQVLDPAMGSGHFLVEALNQLTSWATDMLDRYPEHPLIEEIDKHRKEAVREQAKKDVTINTNLLTPDVILKRMIMKRCIFGVDLNPHAVEITKLSLWLDSFAIGIPLTYMNHHIKTGDSTIGMQQADIPRPENQSLDDWIEDAGKVGELITRVSNSADITVDAVHNSEDEYARYEHEIEPHRVVLDVLTASKMNDVILPKKEKACAEYLDRFLRLAEGKIKKPDKDLIKTRNRVLAMRKRYNFFHWELEMMDAFTDVRHGFDLITGNPPWETVKPNKDEFFSLYDPTYRYLNPNVRKKKRVEELLKNPAIKRAYDDWIESIRAKSQFYKTYVLQGVGDRDLWQIVLERSLSLLSDNGVLSMIIPSQLLANAGGIDMRKHLLKRHDIRSLYVFENRKKIFPIDSRYRFILLTAQNKKPTDEFLAAFYLHELSSLNDNTEKNKFCAVPIQNIFNAFPDNFVIPEVGDDGWSILLKLAKNRTFDEEIDGWSVSLSGGFHRAHDAIIFREDGKGWPILEGRNIHQFIHDYAKPQFTANPTDGLKRESNKKIFGGCAKEVYGLYRVAFRKISGPTNMRTVLAAIIPPNTFHTDSLRTMVLSRNGKTMFTTTEQNNYHRVAAYLVGVLNSSAFDFLVRIKAQLNIPAIIKPTPIPQSSDHDGRIAKLAAKLTVGDEIFDDLAESLRIDNVYLTPREIIETRAELDALTAHAYGLSKKEYGLVLDSFKFDEDPELHKQKKLSYDSKTLKKLNGEMRKRAPNYYDQIAKETIRKILSTDPKGSSEIEAKSSLNSSDITVYLDQLTQEDRLEKSSEGWRLKK